MYLIVVGWFYVVLMMAVVEGTSTTGTVLGAIVTFLLYGVVPLAVVVYIMGTPGRKRAIKARETAELAEMQARQAAEASSSGEPDAGGEASADPVAPVRKEP